MLFYFYNTNSIFIAIMVPVINNEQWRRDKTSSLIMSFNKRQKQVKLTLHIPDIFGELSRTMPDTRR